MDDIIVFKIGGSIAEDLSEPFFQHLIALQNAGYKPIIVHGGGPAIKEMLQKLEIKYEFVDGLRKTTEEVMDVAEMVLTGDVNNMLVRKLNRAGIQAIGLSGSDADLLIAEAKNIQRYGFVGEISKVNTAILKQLTAFGCVPVIAPVALGKNSTRYNINADTAAASVAEELAARRLIFVTDVPGVLKENQLLTSVTACEVEQLIAAGTIAGGMIPKVKAAVKGLSDELQEVMIMNGKQSAIGADGKLTGTVITKAVEVI